MKSIATICRRPGSVRFLAVWIVFAVGLGMPRASAQTTIVSTTPPNGATDVSPITPVVFTFSAAMNKEATEVRFMDVSSSPVSYLPTLASWNAAGTQLTISPSPAFPGNAQIFWTELGQDAEGDPLGGFVSGLFTTGEGGGTPPRLLSSDPPMGAANVPPGAPVVFLFNTSMDPEATQAVFLDTTSVPPGVLPTTTSWNAARTQLTHTPSPRFPENRMISWIVAGNDAVGNELSGSSGVFMTGAGEGGTGPMLVSVYPEDGASEVPPEAPVVFTFSRGMNADLTRAQFFDASVPASPLPVTVAWNVDLTQLTCTPNPPFPLDTALVWMLAGEDLDGNALSSMAGSFFTAAAGTEEELFVIRAEVRSAANCAWHWIGLSIDGSPAEEHSRDSFSFTSRTKATIRISDDSWTTTESTEYGVAGGGSYWRLYQYVDYPDVYEWRNWVYSLDPAHDPEAVVIGPGLSLDFDELWSFQPSVDNVVKITATDGLEAGGAALAQGLWSGAALAWPLFQEPIRLPIDKASYIFVTNYSSNGFFPHDEGEGESGGVAVTYDCRITVLRNPGTITGRVIDESTGAPIAGASVRSPELAAVTGADGRYTLEVPSGVILFTVSAPGYITISREVEVLRGRTTYFDFLLEPAGLASSIPLHVESFDAAPQGSLPAGWIAWNFTEAHTPGYNLSDPRSDTYKDWTVISRDRVLAMGASGAWNASRRLSVKPGQFFNGTEVTTLVEGNFLYAESESRDGSQIQYLMSPVYNLSNKRHIYLSYHSIYEQSSNSIGAVEYSIDGGITWLPVVYKLDSESIVRFPSGDIDVVTTLFAPRAEAATYLNPVTGEETGGYYGAFVYLGGGWLELAPFISARAANDPVDSKRVEIFHLPEADNQPAVRVRFVQAGKGGWYFGIDNFGLHSFPPMPLPVITVMPESQLVPAGSTVTLSVAASGEGLSYQWTRNGQPISGQTNPALVLSNVTPADSGDYQVVISNAGGEVVSDLAAVSVYAGVFPPLPDDPPAVADNWDFEDGLSGWTAGGSAFEFQPTQGDNVTVKRMPGLKYQLQTKIGGDYWRDLTYPIGHRGEHWIGTAENRPDSLLPIGTMLGDDATGSLVSKRFQISNAYISFLVGGGDDPARLRVELLLETEAATPGAFPLLARWYVVAAVESGHGEESLRRAMWEVGAHRGRQARIRILDYSMAGHINVDDFRFQDGHPYETEVDVGLTATPAVFQRGRHFFDWDAPVWGFADLHTHPTGHFGLGGKMLHGRPDGSITNALGHCKCSHALAHVSWEGFLAPFNPHIFDTCLDLYRYMIIQKLDEKGPNPHGEGWSDEPWKRFRSWPVFSTISHQQMWHEWIRRAYDGGLRVMVALTVNNSLLARASKGDMPEDDRTNGDLQTAAMKAFAAQHSDFLEIAYDPFQLRDIVRRNKLAVILGSELDDIGNFNSNPLVRDDPANEFERLTSEAIVRDEIDRLYREGIRYIFPIHLTDNPSGGTAVGNPMLNIANRYATGKAFDLEVAPESERITFEMQALDYTSEVELAALLVTIGGLILPAIMEPGFIATLMSLAGAINPAHTVFPDVLGGAGIGIAGALVPVALFAVGNEILFNEFGPGPMPRSIWPIHGNYPTPPASSPGYRGHRNRRGLTPLGEFTVREMMRRGMMIDIDHMSHHMLTNVLDLAESVHGKYPLNSGHNGPRDLAHERSENSRTAEEYQRIQRLGGLAGVGVENGDFDAWIPQSLMPISSRVENDSAGTSKTFAQNYLYVYEKLKGRGIAFGTDLNGFIPAPGPRFGPQSAFAAYGNPKRAGQILAQPANGVLYTPKHGRPLTTPAFLGAVDPEHDTDLPARTEQGYAYNQDQRDFFAALNIFFGLGVRKDDDIGRLASKIHEIADALNDAYPNKQRVKEYVNGLTKGVTGHNPSGFEESIVREQLGRAVYRYKAMNEPAPPDQISKPWFQFRFNQHGKVWDDYHKAFGSNAPMKRCVTMGKEWDINFEGVAHYGLLPDFLQDLSNVGLRPREMSALFASAEYFAQMWTKSLEGAAEFFRPVMHIATPQSGDDAILIEWFADGQEVLEMTDNLSDPGSWQPVPTEMIEGNRRKRAVLPIDRNPSSVQYFRVRKIEP